MRRSKPVREKSGFPCFPKHDKRLLGTWKPDKRRTFAEWNWKGNMSPKKKAKRKAIFGELEITYTRTKVIAVLPHQKWEQSRRYAVVAADETSVAIVLYGIREIKDRRKYDPVCLKIAEETFPPKPEIEHIHFEKEHYWILLGNGRNREYFRRLRR